MREVPKSVKKKHINKSEKPFLKKFTSLRKLSSNIKWFWKYDKKNVLFVYIAFENVKQVQAFLRTIGHYFWKLRYFFPKIFLSYVTPR